MTLREGMGEIDESKRYKDTVYKKSYLLTNY